jgi:2TM domain-containing protein
MADQMHEHMPDLTDGSERADVRRQLQSRRDFSAHVLVYVVVNAALVFIWAMTGAGYFWPAWVMGFWGIGLVMHAYDAFIRRPVTDEDVDRALRKRQSR